MDALAALVSAPSYRAGWARYRAAHPDAEERGLLDTYRRAAQVGLVWEEIEQYADEVLGLLRLQRAHDDLDEARALALQALRDAAEPASGRKRTTIGPDLLTQRARAYADLDRGDTARVLAASKLRDAIERRRRALIQRIDAVRYLQSSPSDLDHELADRFGRLGDLDRVRELVGAIRSRSLSQSTLIATADELAAARARAERAALLRDRALTVGEAIAAEGEHAAALAEVRAIERRDVDGGEDALSAGLAHVEAMAAAGRLPT